MRDGATGNPPVLAIIGAGITGLSAAYYAYRTARERGLELRIKLIERGAQLGGKIHTLRKEGFVIEKGPDSFLSRKLPILELTRDIGFEDELVPLDPNHKKTYILHHGRFHRIPPGMVMGIPTEMAPFITTGLLSPAGKARAALDLVLSKRKETGDESLGHFLERRLGREVLQHIAEPLLGGIYAGDVYKLSLRATFPQFHAIEKKYRSLVLGMKASRGQSESGGTLPPLARESMFLSYRHGLSSLAARLEQELEGKVDILRETKVRSIRRSAAGSEIDLEEAGGMLRSISAGAVVVTLPAYAIPELFPDIPQTQELLRIPFVSVANIALAYDRAAVGHPLDGSGFVIPRTEAAFMTACTWTSSKWKHVAPEGKALIRCYVGRSGEEQWQSLSDDELVGRVREELARLMGIRSEPSFFEVTRLMHSMPQYPVGHLELINRVRDALNADAEGRKRVWLAGGSFEGVGLPDCIRQGRDAAKEAVQALTLR